MARLRPGAIINCAASNDVDGAQLNPSPALEINAFGVIALARAAAEQDAVLVHFGTDFVFDGESDRPYTEEDAPRPRSFYGASKLLGERFAEDAPRHYVLRVESIFGGPTAGTTARDGSLGTIVRKLRAGEEVAVFTDRTVSPSYAPDIARATRTLLERQSPSGLYHCVNAGQASWDQIAREAASVLGVVPRLKPITLDSITLAAPRPKYCAMDPSKLAAAGAPMRPWQDALRDWLTRSASVAR
jgi:dTDP-4-dehydrorhamnose reductase